MIEAICFSEIEEGLVLEMKKRIMFILGVFCVLLICGIAVYFWVFSQGDILVNPAPHTITFQEDSLNKTLTVLAFHPQNLTWSDVQIQTGSGTLPTGTIAVGDVITNCSMRGSVVYIVPAPNKVAMMLPFGSWDFTE
jgi:hypothetical protein